MKATLTLLERDARGSFVEVDSTIITLPASNPALDSEQLVVHAPALQG